MPIFSSLPRGLRPLPSAPDTAIPDKKCMINSTDCEAAVCAIIIYDAAQVPALAPLKGELARSA